MIKGAQPQFTTDIQDADAWKALISAFLESRTDLSETKLEVATSSSQVTITISDARALATLNEIFRSAQATRDSLQYALHESDANLSTHLVTSPLFDDSQMRAPEVISHLFSPNLVAECGINEHLLNPANDNKSERVFRIPIPKRAGYDLIWQGRAMMLKAALSPARKGMLMKAFQEDKPFQSNDAVTSNNFTLEPGFEKIVEIEQQADGTKCFAIRYGEYLNLLYPHAPRMENVQNRGSTTSVTLDRKALIDYLRYTFQEGFMLAKRQPVLLPSETPLQKANNVYTLVLDRSGSMLSVFPEYKEKVKTLCQQLVNNICALGDIIRIIDFDDKIGHDEAWVIDKDKNNLFRQISYHINRLDIGGSTNLYGTVFSTLNSLKQKYPEHEHCLVVFTDGDNTSSGITEQQLIDKITEQTGPTAKKPPRIFTLGLGDRYKREVVEKWSHGSGVSHIHLNTMSDFDEIYAQGAKMSRPRLLRHIVQGLFKEAVSVFNDSLTLVSKPLTEGEPFQFAEKNYSYASTRPRVTTDPVEEGLTPPPSFTPGYSAANEAQMAAAAAQEGVVELDKKLQRLEVNVRPS